MNTEDGVSCKYGPWIIFPDGTLISKKTGLPKKAYRKNVNSYWNVTRQTRPGGRGSKTVTLNYLLHRLVAEHFLGPIPEGMEVCFKDGDKGHVHVDNLEYRTHSDNLRQDYQREGSTRTRLTGERNPQAKMTDAQFVELCTRYEAGEAVDVLAAEYGITAQYLVRLCRSSFRRKTTIRKREGSHGSTTAASVGANADNELRGQRPLPANVGTTDHG